MMAPDDEQPPLPPGFEMIQPGQDAPQPQALVDPMMAKAREQVKKDRSGGGIGGAFRSYIGEPLRQFSRGTPLGTWSDEIEAGLQGGLHSVTGGSVGAPYDETLAYQRAYDEAVDQDTGLLGTGLKVAGALVGTPLHAINSLRGAAAVGGGYGALAGSGEATGGAGDRLEGAAYGGSLGGLFGGALYGGAQGIQAIRRARANQGEGGAYGAIADDLPNGVDGLADQVATGASRQNVTTNRRTLDILGEEMRRSGGDVAAAQQATIARIVQETGVAPQTAAGQIRRLSSVHEGSPLMLGEYPAVSGSDVAQRTRQAGNVNLDDLQRIEDSPTQGTLDYLANNGTAQSAADVRNAISRRQETLSPTMRTTLEGMAPRVQTGPRASRPANIEDTGRYVENARRIGSQEYRAAYQGPINNRYSVHFLPRIIEANRNRAAGRAGDYRDAINRALDQFYVPTPQGGRVVMGTLQQLQDARAALRGQMDQYRNAGDTGLVNAVQPIYRQITRLMTRMSPQWAQANRRWADMNFAEMAQELGDNFAEKAGPRFREQLDEFRNLAPQAQDVVRVHWMQKMFDKLDNLPDTNSVSKLFGTDHARRMIREMFGNDAVVTFTRAVRDQRVAERSQAMTGNSRTHLRGQAQKQKDSETGLTAAVENANARGVRNWLLERMTQMLTERRNRPMSRILTTPINDTAQVAQHIARMREQEALLRRLSGPAQVSPRAIGTVGGMIGRGVGGGVSE
jgi:hypothetical protein